MVDIVALRHLVLLTGKKESESDRNSRRFPNNITSHLLCSFPGEEAEGRGWGWGTAMSPGWCYVYNILLESFPHLLALENSLRSEGAIIFP
jgi:hypothetical protein